MIEDSPTNPARVVSTHDRPAVGHSRSRGQSFLLLARQHGAPILVITIACVGLSWPLVADFSNQVVGQGPYETYHHIWFLWHVGEATFNGQSVFHTPNLYFPAGHSLLAHGLGPVMGLLALPLWVLGPEAAYNGVSIASLILSAWCLYLLARELGHDPDLAIFGAILLAAAPMHLAGLRGHLNKLLLAGPIMTFLAYHRATSLGRSGWWSVATGIALLLTLAHDGYQFVFTALALVVLSSTRLWQASRRLRPTTLRRHLLTAGACVLMTAPFIVATIIAVRQLGISVTRQSASAVLAPDLLNFVVPYSYFSRILGPIFDKWLQSLGAWANIEQTVYLSWTGLTLAAVGLVKGSRQRLPWMLAAAALLLFSLGPTLKVTGEAVSIAGQVPVGMPFGLLNRLPGLDFMRTPGRAMMVGYSLWALAATSGLAVIVRRWPRCRAGLVVGFTLMLLVEFWPPLWPSFRLAEVPPFYHRLAAEPGAFGVLDLPIRPPGVSHIDHSARYQLYQMTHGKGILGGYLSRTFETHPVLPCIVPQVQPPRADLLVNSRPVRCEHNLLYDLATLNYRYIVVHHTSPTDGGPTEALGASDRQILDLLGSQLLVYSDSYTDVYRVPPAEQVRSTAITSIALGEGWHLGEAGIRWANSPAFLVVSSPEPQHAELKLSVHDVRAVGWPGPQFASTRLSLSTTSGWQWVGGLSPGETLSIPLTLAAGINPIRLEVSDAAWPSLTDWSERRYALTQIDLQLAGE